MASNAATACCVTGVKHEGEAVGDIQEVGGFKSYVTYPPNKSTKYAILYLPDAFGLELNNNKLLADDFARAGYLVIIPDIFRGNPIPSAFRDGVVKNFDLQAWLSTHPASAVEPVIEATIKAMRSDLGVETIGAVGYCFGGKYVMRFLAGRGVDAGFTAHPSLVDEADVERVQGPISIAAAETDRILPPELRHKFEEILLKKDVAYQIILYGDCEHGFAVRADLTNRKKKFAKESAYFQAVRWFDEYLKN